LNFTVLIPARLASTRLPNKPLADIAGIPMVVRVAQRVMSGVAGGTRVVVAGDSPLILQACQAHGVEAVLTRADHASGSDRLAQACDLLGLADDSLVVNVQGDEPLIDPNLVAAVASLLLQRPEASMSTAAHPIDTLDDFTNPNVVKVVVDARQLALYFSRAPIPHWRDQPKSPLAHGALTPVTFALPQPAPLRHIGIYGYRTGFLRQFPKLSPAPIEVTESLEQLRAMWHGHRIAVHITDHPPGPGVDTAQDLQRVRQLLGAQI
jgi:3-deoxy-manno-octulosonate cytidylyltransferase (CMP-KDO synthetase)